MTRETQAIADLCRKWSEARDDYLKKEAAFKEAQKTELEAYAELKRALENTRFPIQSSSETRP